MFRQDETTLLRTHRHRFAPAALTLLEAHKTQSNITHYTWLLSYFSLATQMGRIGT